MYVGSSGDVRDRIWNHVGALRRGVHYNANLQDEWNEYGESSFLFVRVEQVPKDKCFLSEQQLLDFYWDTGLLFNVFPTADSPLGRKHSDETKAKISAAHMGKIGSWTGRKHTEETKAKISAANKGQNKGGTLPESTRRKIGDAQRGRKRSGETRAKISASQVGRILSVESRKKMSDTKRRKSGLFTDADIASIRSRYIPSDPIHGQSAMAREYGVSTCAIWRILKGIR